MSWGNKLLITFIVFGSGMVFLVYRCMKTDFELVEKDYYKNELAYQQVIDAAGRSGKLSSTAKFSQTQAGLQLQLPEEMKGRAIEGEVWFYCAYDSRKDKRVPIAVNGSAFQLFEPGVPEAGNYVAKISWRDGSDDYYYETPLTVH